MTDRPIPDPAGILRSAARDRDLGFEVTASWADVQRKAKRIRAEGGVTIVVASNDGVGGQVKGDHHTYEAILVFRPGTHKVADWTCGCAWNAFAFDRSPAFRRFDGRKCSHALALQYEAQSQGMFGKEIHPSEPPRKVPTVVKYDPDDGASVYARPYEGSLAAVAVARLRAEDADPAEIIGSLVQTGMKHAAARGLWKNAGSLGPQDCEYCGKPAAKALMWAEHMAYVPVCDDHRQHAAEHLEAQGDDVEAVRDLPQKTAHFEGEHRCPHCGGFIGMEAMEHHRCPHCGAPLGGEAEGHRHEAASHGGEDVYLRFGHWPKDERSQNGVTGHREEGVSVYDLDHHGEPMDPDPHMSRGHEHDEYCEPDCDMHLDNDDYGNDTREEMHGRVHRAERNRYNGADRNGETGHLVKGDMVGFGHDGEPLLRNVRRVGDWIDHRHHFIPTAEPHRLADESEEHRHEGARQTGLDLVDAGELGPVLAAKAEEPSGPTVSGIALKAHDTGRVLMLQRGLEDEDDPARGTWEMPGGHHEEGDLTSLHAGIREFQEEVGQEFPAHGVVKHTWTSPDGVYQGHVVVIPSEKDLSMKDGRVVPNPDDPKGDHHEQAAWWEIAHAKKNPALRAEVKAHTPWKEIEKASLDTAKTASSWDPISNTTVTQPGRNLSEPQHSTSKNPVSTGFATSEDPSNWDNVDVGPTSGGVTPAMSFDSTLHDRLEPALPSTDGAAEYHPEIGQEDLDPVPDDPAQPDPYETRPGIAMDEAGTSAPNTYHSSLGERTLAEIVADFQKSAGAQALAVPEQARQDTDDIAAAARAHLSKTALADFSPEEQRELINENPDARARNFDGLKLDGSHYALLEEAMAHGDVDPSGLFI